MDVDINLLHAWSDWFGHDFDDDDRCVLCAKTAVELSKRKGLPVCDGERTAAAVDRAMRTR